MQDTQFRRLDSMNNFDFNSLLSFYQCCIISENQIETNFQHERELFRECDSRFTYCISVLLSFGMIMIRVVHDKYKVLSLIIALNGRNSA